MRGEGGADDHSREENLFLCTSLSDTLSFLGIHQMLATKRGLGNLREIYYRTWQTNSLLFNVNFNCSELVMFYIQIYNMFIKRGDILIIQFFLKIVILVHESSLGLNISLTLLFLLTFSAVKQIEIYYFSWVWLMLFY